MSAVTILLAKPANGVSPSGTLTNTTGLVRLSVAITAGTGPASYQLIKQNADSTAWYFVSNAVLNVDDGSVGQLNWEDLEGNALYHVVQTRPSGQSAVLTGASGYLSASSVISQSVGAVTTTTLTASGAIVGQSTLAITGATTLTGAVSMGSTLAVTGAVTHTSTLTQTGIATFNAAPVFAAGATASGAVAFNLGGSTADFTTPTGAITIAGAAGKNIAISTLTTGTITIDNAAAWSVGATGGLTGTIGRSGQLVALAGNVTVAGTLGTTGVTTMTGAAALLGTAPAAAADAVKYGVADINGATTAAEKTVYEGGGTLLRRVYSAAGALKLMYIDESVADDATITLPVPQAGGTGILTIGALVDGGMALTQNDGTVTKVSGSTNFVATDTDVKLCFFNDATVPTIRNRLGGATRVIATYMWS